MNQLLVEVCRMDVIYLAGMAFLLGLAMAMATGCSRLGSKA